jgi:hypothetical protein
VRIPVYLEGREIERIGDYQSNVHRLYNKWWKIFGVRKIYRVPGKMFVMENRYRPPVIIKGDNK